MPRPLLSCLFETFYLSPLILPIQIQNIRKTARGILES